jgi:hypothetical protein
MLDTIRATFSESNWYKTVQGFSFDDMVTSNNKFFNPDNFNTPIPENRKVEYSNWAKANVTDSGHDYDYAGAFLAGFDRSKDPAGHLPDTFKKPNHPTFSVHSKYATGAYKKYAGSWAKIDNTNIYKPAKATLKAVKAYTRTQGVKHD